MRMRVSGAVAALIALSVGTAMLAAPGQERPVLAIGTDRPGLPTIGQLWIANRGRHEAIPVVAPDPIPVVVQNPVRQWEYQTLSVTTGMLPPELTRMLTAQGDAGWETAGVQVVNGPSTLLVMKRPRPNARFDAREPASR